LERKGERLEGRKPISQEKLRSLRRLKERSLPKANAHLSKSAVSKRILAQRSKLHQE